MKLIISAALTLAAAAAQAESRIDALCGPGHVNEAVSLEDIDANPDGYYIRSLKTQIRHGDPRIVQAVGDVFHLCTRPAATPEMDSTLANLLINEREVKYLFVPLCPKTNEPNS